MTIIPGTSRILNGYGTTSDRGTPPMIQLAVGSSLLLLARRCLYRASAQGWKGTSPGLRSLAMSPTYTPGPGIHNPVRSGLPSALFGAGAERSALPLGRRGIPVMVCRHCAAAGIAASIMVAIINRRFIVIL